jgi:hypothetical protein
MKEKRGKERINENEKVNMGRERKKIMTLLSQVKRCLLSERDVANCRVGTLPVCRTKIKTPFNKKACFTNSVLCSGSHVLDRNSRGLENS